MSTDIDTKPLFRPYVSHDDQCTHPLPDARGDLHRAHHVLFVTSMTAVDEDAREYLAVAMRLVGAALRRLDK